MERFISGQKVRILTVDELLKKGYKIDEDGDIYVGGDDEFFVKPMQDYCNVEHEITASEDKKQQFTIENFRFTPGMCEEVESKLKIKIKYFDGAKELEKISKGDWIDLYANKDMFIEEGSRAMIPLGVAMELPDGYEAHLVPRSSTFKTWGIIQTNHMGVIDHSFMGDNDQWHMPVYCLMGKDIKKDKFYTYDDYLKEDVLLSTSETKGTYIHKGDKICQFRIMEIQPEIEFEKVEVLENEDRNGFGSTGSK